MADALRLTFLTNSNERVTLSIPYPNRDVSETEIKDAMSDIITSNAVMAKNSLLKSKLEAELETVTEVPYSI